MVFTFFQRRFRPPQTRAYLYTPTIILSSIQACSSRLCNPRTPSQTRPWAPTTQDSTLSTTIPPYTPSQRHSRNCFKNGERTGRGVLLTLVVANSVGMTSHFRTLPRAFSYKHEGIIWEYLDGRMVVPQPTHVFRMSKPGTAVCNKFTRLPFVPVYTPDGHGAEVFVPGSALLREVLWYFEVYVCGAYAQDPTTYYLRGEVKLRWSTSSHEKREGGARFQAYR